ncbi:hypothetical protein ACC689_09795 [Rhizobium ruizarguesonis]
MIPSVVLDPSFFWLFSASDTELEAEAIWQVCRPWLNDNEHGAKLLVHGKSIERLREKGLIPAFDSMREMIERLNLSHVVSPNELSRVVDRFLSNMITLEEVAPVCDALFENVSFDPDAMSAIGDTDLRDHSKESASISALNSHIGKTMHYAFPRLAIDPLTVTVRGNVILADVTNGVLIPDTYEQDLILLRDPARFRSVLDPQHIWDQAEDDDEVKFAVQLAAEGLAAGELPKCSVGPSFLSSLRRNQAINGAFSAATLTKCAQALAGVEGISIKEFKYEPVGNKAAKVRIRPKDGASAYRAHIPSGALGLRLMLWKLVSGAWEFANVGPKNEEIIEMG